MTTCGARKLNQFAIWPIRAFREGPSLSVPLQLICFVSLAEGHDRPCVRDRPAGESGLTI